MTSRQQTIEQKRAAKAWQCIEEVQQKKDELIKKKYGSLARKLPSLIQVNGLGQTLAFIYAKARSQESNRGAEARASGMIFSQVSDWVKGELNVADSGDLLEVLVKRDSRFYRRATAEALAFLNWLRRFAEAELPTEDGGGKG